MRERGKEVKLAISDSYGSREGEALLMRKRSSLFYSRVLNWDALVLDWAGEP
jgi:hypothetical protein